MIGPLINHRTGKYDCTDGYSLTGMDLTKQEYTLLFLLKLLNLNQSNWRPVIRWYFPLQWLFPGLVMHCKSKTLVTGGRSSITSPYRDCSLTWHCCCSSPMRRHLNVRHHRRLFFSSRVPFKNWTADEAEEDAAAIRYSKILQNLRNRHSNSNTFGPWC